MVCIDSYMDAGCENTGNAKAAGWTNGPNLRLPSIQDAVGDNSQGENVAIRFYGGMRFPARSNVATLSEIESAVTGKGRKWRGS